jgi:hypothetical protein
MYVNSKSLLLLLLLITGCGDEDVTDVCDSITFLDGQMSINNENYDITTARLTTSSGRGGTDAYNFSVKGVLSDCTFARGANFIIEIEKGTELGGTYPIGNQFEEGIDKLIVFTYIEEDIVNSTGRNSQFVSGNFEIIKQAEKEYSLRSTDFEVERANGQIPLRFFFQSNFSM